MPTEYTEPRMTLITNRPIISANVCRDVRLIVFRFHGKEMKIWVTYDSIPDDNKRRQRNTCFSYSVSIAGQYLSQDDTTKMLVF
jgi:hypothetical protein